MKTYQVYARSTTEPVKANKRQFRNRSQAIKYANDLLNKFKKDFTNEYSIAYYIHYTDQPINLSAELLKHTPTRQIIKLHESAANNVASIHFETKSK